MHTYIFKIVVKTGSSNYISIQFIEIYNRYQLNMLHECLHYCKMFLTGDMVYDKTLYDCVILAGI